jgi:hypothetical protein
MNLLIVFSISAMKKSSDNNQVSDALKDKRRSLLKALVEHRFADALKIFHGSQYVLNGDIDEFLINALNKQFAQNFIEINYTSNAYRKYIRPLMHCGFDLDVKDQRGRPLLSKVMQLKEDKYLDLLKGGASVNAKDKDGNTPLLYAVGYGYLERIPKLLLYGAVVNDRIGMQVPDHHKAKPLLAVLFEQQHCWDCKTHNNDLSPIPCVNRHLGNFMCEPCYQIRHQEEKGCPFCRRSFGEYAVE